MRHAAKPDASQAAIVEALRKAGYGVDIQRRPVDLRVWNHSRWGKNFFVELECKTPRGKRNPAIKLDKRQQEQADYCALHDVPYVGTPDEALRYLRTKHTAFFD